MIQCACAISDLGLATALSCAGFKLLGLDRTNPRRVRFCFDDDGSGRIGDIEKAFWDGSLRLPAVQLLAQQKLLKQRLYAEQ